MARSCRRSRVTQKSGSSVHFSCRTQELNVGMHRRDRFCDIACHAIKQLFVLRTPRDGVEVKLFRIARAGPDLPCVAVFADLVAVHNINSSRQWGSEIRGKPGITIQSSRLSPARFPCGLLYARLVVMLCFARFRANSPSITKPLPMSPMLAGSGVVTPNAAEPSANDMAPPVYGFVVWKKSWAVVPLAVEGPPFQAPLIAPSAANTSRETLLLSGIEGKRAAGSWFAAWFSLLAGGWGKLAMSLTVLKSLLLGFFGRRSVIHGCFATMTAKLSTRESSVRPHHFCGNVATKPRRAPLSPLSKQCD